MILDYKEIDDLNRYKIMSGSIVPRPVAWIVSEDNGVVNCAPFSYFIPISSNPALVVVAIGQRDDESPKDSLANILKNKKATICLAQNIHKEQIIQSATPLPKTQSEIKEFKIDVKKVLEDFPPMIETCQSALFCEYYDTINIPSKTTPVILEIKKQFIADDQINEKNHINLDNIARCGVTFKALVDL